MNYIEIAKILNSYKNILVYSTFPVFRPMNGDNIYIVINRKIVLSSNSNIVITYLHTSSDFLLNSDFKKIKFNKTVLEYIFNLEEFNKNILMKYVFDYKIKNLT